MKNYSTRETAKKLKLSMATLNKYIAHRLIPIPPLSRIGNMQFRVWTREDIQRVREILPKIANGRKTRHKKKAKKTGKKGE
jgi:hypothetical protein